jgi:hypothetical protein
MEPAARSWLTPALASALGVSFGWWTAEVGAAVLPGGPPIHDGFVHLIERRREAPPTPCCGAPMLWLDILTHVLVFNVSFVLGAAWCGNSKEQKPKPLTARHASAGSLTSVALLTLLAVTALAQDPAAKSAPAQAVPPAAAQQVAMPDAETIVLLLRTSLLTLNDALQTGNFTVLRDLAAPGFRDANFAARLSATFGNLMRQGTNLVPVAILAPQLGEPPAIDPKTSMLRIKGSFPGQPGRLDFEVLYRPVRVSGGCSASPLVAEVSTVVGVRIKWMQRHLLISSRGRTRRRGLFARCEALRGIAVERKGASMLVAMQLEGK